MVDHARAARMEKRIMNIVAQAIGSTIRDPRMSMITITDCKVTGDLHDATVYYTVRGATLDEEPNLNAARNALKRVRGQLRSIVGQQLGVRFTPTLNFVYDAVPEASAHIEDLLAKARQRDEELRKAAENAEFAGDSDPYKD